MEKKKLGIVIDSSFGFSEKEALERGFYFVPIVVDFDGKEYASGRNIDIDFMVENMNKKTKVSTAAVKLGELTEAIKKASEESEKVLVIPLSKGLSSIHGLCEKVAGEFDNVTVYDSSLIPPWTYPIREDITKLMQQGDMEAIIKKLDLVQEYLVGYVMPQDLVALRNGGRITTLQYKAASLLSVQPIIYATNGKLTERPAVKKRKYSRAVKFVGQEIKKEHDELVAKGYEVEILYVDNSRKADGTARMDELKQEIESHGLKVGRRTILTPAIICHTGPGTVAAFNYIVGKK